MGGAVTRQKDWMFRPTAAATGSFIVAAMPIYHKLGASRPVA
jgi:hypothetical protein